MHTAIAAMQLVEEGALDLHEPITTYVPQIKLSGEHDASELTLHQCLAHTAALPDLWYSECTSDLDDWWTGWEPELLVEPDVVFNYSSSNTSLAGYVLEEVVGKPYVDLMAQQVLEPAGMEGATFSPEAVQGSYAIGYSNGEYFAPNLYDCPFLRPAGWLHASVVDLAYLAEQFLDDGGAILTADSVAAMADQVDTRHALRPRHGYGQFNWVHHGVPIVGHSGSGVGQTSYWMYAPDKGFAVALAANSMHFDPWQVAERAADLFLDCSSDWDEPDLATDPSSWGVYVGTYEDPVNVGTIEVTLDENLLHIRFLDGSNVQRRLYQYGLDEFFFEYDDTRDRIRFFAGEEGDIRYLVNEYYVGARQGR
jgi:CubicO group peptidase (beta-lactamase class C family)